MTKLHIKLVIIRLECEIRGIYVLELLSKWYDLEMCFDPCESGFYHFVQI